MSNRAHPRPSRRVDVSETLASEALDTPAGRSIAADVAELKAWCDLNGLDFDKVSDLFDRYSKKTNKNLVDAVRSFKVTIMQVHRMTGELDPGLIEQASAPAPQERSKLVLPGDKDFRA